MTKEFFINETQIKSPLNVEGFYLLKEVDPRFNGSISEQTGSVEDISGIIINDPNAVELIKALRDTYLTEARADMICVDHGKELFRGNIDFLSLTKDRSDVITLALNDPEASVFITNIEKPYALNLPDQHTFSSETVYTDYSLILDSEKLEVITGSIQAGALINPVYKADSKATLLGSIMETEDFLSRPFYKNSAGYKIRLNMDVQVFGSISSSSPVKVFAKLLIRDTNGVSLYDLTVTTISVNGTSSFAVVDQYSLDIAIDANVSLFFVPESNTNLTINFGSDSKIDLSEGDLSNINIPVISVNDAFSMLVNKASNGMLQYVPYAGLDHLKLSSYANVRGREAFLNTSFGQLWDCVNNLYCLKLSKSGNKIIAASFVDSFDSVSSFEIYDLSNFIETMDIQHLYSEVSSGFDEWKPKNDAGKPENTAPLTMSTKLNSVGSTLILSQNSYIGSLKVLSEAYLMRNRPGSENDNEGLDQMGFILSTDPKKPINSVESINQWIPFIGSYHQNLSKESGEGLYMNTDVQIDLRDKPTIFTPYSIIIDCNINTEDFKGMGSFCSFSHIDRTYVVYMMRSIHYPFKSTTEQGNTTIEGRLINIQNYA